ncbi:MAG: glycine betaine ABC transporter substrate-binding protein [Bryobacteraceae bacterium]
MDRAKIAVGIAIALLCASCSGPRRIVVGSKNFTEQLILGEIIAQHLERRLAQKVDRKLNLGGTLLAQQALVSGQIDLYPEYTGTALTAILKMPAAKGASQVLERVRAEYRTRWGIEWLPPLGFDNTFAMVISQDEARRGGYETLSQAAARKPGWRLGIGYEFQTREDGLPGLMKTYQLPLAGSPKSMDLGLLYQALKQGQVDMVAGSATDGVIPVLGLRILRDDKSYFPPYQAAVVARADRLSAVPGLREALAELSGKVSTEAMQKMNYKVDGEHRSIADVAREFLK